MTSVTPTIGSLYGGTEITIEGKGFHNETKTTIGGTQCVGREITYGQIICDLKSTETVYNITNQGVHPSM